MREETEHILQKALALPDSERAELAGSLIASLDANIDPDADSAWQEEVARRAEEVRTGKVVTVPWEQVQRKARAVLNGK